MRARTVRLIGKPIAVAAWIVEHLSVARDPEALSGDLLEQVHGGRPMAWLWRQVAVAVAIGVCRRARAGILPLTFSAAWSTLYPLWSVLGERRLLAALPHGVLIQAVALSWPGLTLWELVNGIVPAIAFTWLGFLVYLVSSRHLRGVSRVRILGGFSSGLTVLLLATLALLYQLKDPIIDLRCIGQDGFYSLVHLFAISVPLAASVYTAIVSAVPREPRLATVGGSGAARRSLL